MSISTITKNGRNLAVDWWFRKSWIDDADICGSGISPFQSTMNVPTGSEYSFLP